MPQLPAGMPKLEMIHPMIVHFAIALPVILLILELSNFAFRRKSIGFMNFLLTIIVFLLFVGAYYTGVADAQNAKELMSPEAKEVLVAHKNLALLLIYGSAALVLIKLLGAVFQGFVFKLLFVVGTLLFIFGIFTEVKKGGELVYKYGTNVMAHSTMAPATPTQVTTPAVNTPQETQPNTTTTPAAQEKTTEPASTTEAQSTTAPSDVAKDTIVNTTNTIKTSVKDAASSVTDVTTKVTQEATQVLQDTVHTMDKSMNDAPTQQ